MKKQTAVDWLEKFLKERYPLMDSEAIFQHAKEMEKEQIEYSYYEAWTESDSYYRDEKSILKIAEKYYNETYGKI